MGYHIGLLTRRLIHRLRLLVHGSAGRRHRLVGSIQSWQRARAFQREFLVAQGMKPEHRLIDIGCGTLRGGIPLIDWLDPGHYSGLDVRADHLAEARRELEETGLASKKPKLVLSEDFSQLEFEPADFIWAFAVLIHMSNPVLEECMAFVARHLKPDGTFFATVNVGEEGQPGFWRGFPVMRHPPQFWDELAARHGMHCEDLGSVLEVGNRGDDGALPADQRRMYRFRRTQPA
jgi:predicted TPR repeat methyltransferase